MIRKRDAHSRHQPILVEVLVGTWKQYGRGIITGVWRYAREQGSWLLDLDPTEADESTAIPAGMKVRGIIALVHTREFAKKLRAYGVPVVNVSGTVLKGVTFPRVTSDARAVVRVAAEHLHNRGFTSLAFCGEPHRQFIDHWAEAYLDVMSEMKTPPLVYTPSAKLSPHAKPASRQRDLQRWLQGLGKPVGVIGWDTEMCRHLAMACTVSGIAVPDEVAIISLESEDLLGRVVHPPLSGVDIPVERIGYEAARLLDMLLRGRGKKVEDIVIPPLGVVTRQSTDVFAVEDPKLKQALRFIRDHAQEGITVCDVLRTVPVARRTMERRFNELLGHSPSEEIRKTKLEKVRELLLTTELPIPDIAEAAGFNYVEHMISLFKKRHGVTPSKYRRRVASPSRNA
jgi:LacI family transcriptional regulator